MKQFFTAILVFFAVTCIYGQKAKIDKAVTGFLGDGWKLVSSKIEQSKAEIVNTSNGKALKISAAPLSWTIIRKQIEGLEKGEIIEMEVSYKSIYPNIASLISSGFVWGPGSPEGNKMTKQIASGNGQWQKLRLSLKVEKQPVTIGIGLERRNYPTSITIGAIKILKGKDILQQRIKRALAIKIGKKIPEELQKFLKSTKNKLKFLQKELVKATGKELIKLTGEINSKLEDMERICIVANGKFNPAVIKAVNGNVNIKLYDTAFTHSVWYRVIYNHKKAINLSYNINSKLYPLSKADLLLVPAVEPVMLNIKVPAGVSNITLQSLDFLMEHPVKHHFKVLAK